MKNSYFLLAIIAISYLCAITFSSCEEEVENQPPVIEIISPEDGFEIKEGQSIPIEIKASDPDGGIKQVVLFIDGTPRDTFKSPPYIYTWKTDGESQGSHSIKATASDWPQLATASDEITVNVNIIPIANFYGDYVEGLSPLRVKFLDVSTHDPTSWLWDFGDGNSSTEQHPEHSYQNEGSYTVSLSASNDNGTDMHMKEAYIQVNSAGNLGKFTDFRDGQVYNTVKIGTQTWFAQALNYKSEKSIAERQYEKDQAEVLGFGDLVGRFYLFEEVEDICPTGWHVSSDDEWKTLEMFVGMTQEQADSVLWRGSNEGEKLKSDFGWKGSLANGTNELGFNVVPIGRRQMAENNNSGFEYNAFFITSTERSGTDRIYARYFTGNLFSERNKIYRDGLWPTIAYASVRCVKD